MTQFAWCAECEERHAVDYDCRRGRLPWDDQPHPPTDEQVATLAAERGVALGAPLGARLLGCTNCRAGDRLRHPELGMVYCADCPVERRRR